MEICIHHSPNIIDTVPFQQMGNMGMGGMGMVSESQTDDYCTVIITTDTFIRRDTSLAENTFIAYTTTSYFLTRVWETWEWA